MKLGPGLDPETQLGPLVSHEHRDSVEGLHPRWYRRGRRSCCAAASVPKVALEAGAFLTPAVFTGVDDGMSIARDEIFGPVICVHAVR